MKLIYRFLIILIFFSVLIIIIITARGYRPDLQKKTITSTGIIAVSAYPKAAKVYIDGKLKGATDINLNLPPGEYQIEVKKEGYTSWKKTVKIQGEIVSTLDVLLFPVNPSLSPLTNLGLVGVIPVPQSTKIILFSQNTDPSRQGIYLFDSSQNPLSLFPSLKEIISFENLTKLVGKVDLKDTQTIISADGKQAIFQFKAQNLSFGGENFVSYLFSLDDQNIAPFDVSLSKDTLTAAWEKEKQEINRKVLEAYPKEISRIASDSFHIVSFSADESKILYFAKNKATLPLVINPPLIGANQTPQERIINKGGLYVYDRKEDRNYPIKISGLSLQNTNSIIWYSDSKHLVINQGNKISIVDFDGENLQTVYSGPFEKNFFAVASDGKIIILTNLNPQTNLLPDLYSVGIR